MFLLLPTCDSHAAIASISLALLARYWPGHPRVDVLHYAVKPRVESGAGVELHDCGVQQDSPWLATMARFLERQREELFLLLLDDYALCGPARIAVIEAGEKLMRDDASVGLFPLSWYPAGARSDRAGADGVITLHRAPILLQAAIWRRAWFLELASGMGPRTSPWGFESLATQKARKIPRAICTAKFAEPRYVGGHLVDGFDKSDWPLPYHNLMHRGEPELAHEAFLHAEGFAFPSRGLGDTVGKLAQWTGAAALAGQIERLTGRECGCNRRRARLNQAVPYRKE